MDSDDEYQSFSTLPEPSSEFEPRRLKRLRKKATHASINPPPDSADDLVSFPRVDFAQLEALEASEIKTLDSQYDDSNESSDPSPDTLDDLLPTPRVDFAKLEADEASETRKLDSQFDDSEEPVNPEPDSVDDLLPVPRVDFAKLEALEATLIKSSGFLSDESNERLLSQSSSGRENEMKGEKKDEKENTLRIGDGLEFGEDSRGIKRTLEFDDDGQRKGELKLEISGKKQKTECSSHGEMEEENKKKRKKNKRSKRDNCDDLKSKAPAPNKRTQEKERKVHLQQLRAESQRLFRETIDASFKPIPIVNKPISSILEKIRKRKLEVSKKLVMHNSTSYISENNCDLEDSVLEIESENVSVKGKEDKSVKEFKVDATLNQMDGLSTKTLDLENEKESTSPLNCGKFPTSVECDKKSTSMLQSHSEDTQDAFEDSDTRKKEAELSVEDLDSPMEEVFAPSVLAMNLKLDSVPSDDSSSEEENDKENVDPISDHRGDDSPSPRGDPVKAFVDEEAEEEDNSDNDLLLFKETEEDENLEDSEEFNDMIATEYDEKPIDNEMRSELHQKWLQQQDASGTENLLQKLKVSSKLRETSPVAQENDDSEDEIEDNDVDEDDELSYPTRINLKKAKQIISQMFLDKDEVLFSDEDEETEKKIVKNRHQRAEERAPLVSLNEDESSREVFGLIKKLNITPQTRRKAKSSYFDSVLKGGDDKCFPKSSFLGRSSNHHLPSSRMKSSTAVRSFIFGRDDSNSRSSISTSDECTDMIMKEKQSVRTVTAKFSSSQTKFNGIQYGKASKETHGTSLFEILKRSSEQSSVRNHDDSFDLDPFISTFRIPKNPIKMGGRT